MSTGSDAIANGRPFKDKDNNMYVIEKIDMSQDSDLDLDDDVAELSELDDIRADENDLNDLDKLISTANQKQPLRALESDLARSTQFERRPEAKTIKRTEVIDDFIRNFMIKHKMQRSLEAFQQEWYELAQKGKFSDNELGPVPDVFIKNERLEEKVQHLSTELEKAKVLAEKAKATWDKLRKERDFHKMHHHRVQQEKLKMNRDIEKLKELHRQYESKYQDLSSKYEAAMKEKMLLKLERDRLVSKSDALQKTVENLEDKITREVTGDKLPELKETRTMQQGMTTNKPKPTSFPAEDRTNPYMNMTYESFNTKSLQLSNSYSAHQQAITSLAVHPTKNFIATSGDDLTWKVFTFTGELLLSGEGHKDWVSSVCFHPKGNHLATASGDSTIKFWDFVNAKIVYTFSDHIQPVWSIDINDTGDFLVSSSMDHTCKLFDLNVGKNRYTFRGHVDSVNQVTYQPFSNIFASASADKTVSLWDMKSGLCVQTFYGHLNSINGCSFTPRGDTIASCDSDGIVKIWDVRMVKERNQLDAGPYSANCCAYDKSGTVLAVGGDEKVVRMYNDASGRLESTLKGHDDAILDIKFDYHSHKILFTCSSDKSFKVWK